MSAHGFDSAFLVALLIRMVELRNGWNWVLDHLPWSIEADALDIAALRNAFQNRSRGAEAVAKISVLVWSFSTICHDADVFVPTP